MSKSNSLIHFYHVYSILSIPALMRANMEKKSQNTPKIKKMSKKRFVQFSFHLSTLSLMPAFCIFLRKLPSDLIDVVATAINNRQPVCGKNTMCSTHINTCTQAYTLLCCGKVSTDTWQNSHSAPLLCEQAIINANLC